MSAIFSLKNISKNFGKLKANDDISFDIEEGTIHALLGENGAGKSTLVKIIYGSQSPDQGTMIWQGNSYQPKNPLEARQVGIAKVFQHFSLFESLDVSENIALGLGEMVDDQFKEKIIDFSQRYGLKVEPDQKVGTLSVGVRQRIEIIRCLLQNPKLLIMDEPTSVLTPQEVDQLFFTLNQLVKEGCTILYISHKLDEVKQFCDQATILRQGKQVADCQPKTTSKHDLIEMMLGKKFSNPSRKEVNLGNSLFKIENLNWKSDDLFGVTLKAINLELKKGSITGIAGVAGNGQDELMSILTGETPVPHNTLQFCGENIGTLGPDKRRELGIFFTPDERLGHATVPDMSLRDNMLISRPQKSKMTSFGFIHWSRVNSLADQVIEKFQVKTQSRSATAKSLSGGNLQKFIIGRELIQSPLILFVNQPTWGVDAGSASHIHQTLIELADNGMAILLISQDLDEILFLCDQVQVLSEGKLSHSMEVDQLDLEQLGKYMLEQHA